MPLSHQGTQPHQGTQSYTGTVRVDFGELEPLVEQLTQLKDSLHAQMHHVSSLRDVLHQAFSGSAVNLTTFDQRFDHWMQMLNTISGEIDAAMTRIKNLPMHTFAYSTIQNHTGYPNEETQSVLEHLFSVQKERGAKRIKVFRDPSGKAAEFGDPTCSGFFEP